MAFKDKIQKFIGDDGESADLMISNDEYYKNSKQKNNNGGVSMGENKMILLEPRAFSEAQTISDYLRSRNTVVVNLKRVTPEIAKRIVDFLSGAVYAIDGDLQKLGNGIILCTPKTVNVEGKISGDEKPKASKKVEEKDDPEFDF